LARKRLGDDQIAELLASLRRLDETSDIGGVLALTAER
jgi:hypothetical protein